MSGLNKENCAWLYILEDASHIYNKIKWLSKAHFEWDKENEYVNYTITDIMEDINLLLKRNVGLFSEKREAVKFGYTRVKNIVGNCLTNDHQDSHTLVGFEKFLEMIEFNVFLVQNQKNLQNRELMARAYDRLDAHIVACAQKAKKSVTSNDLKYANVKVADLKDLKIYANLNSIGCRLYSHRVVAARRKYLKANNEVDLILPVHHCLTCGKTFMGAQTYDVFRNTFTSLPEKKPIPDLDDIDGDDFTDEFEEQSFLRECGYTVRDGVLTTHRRRTILISVLEEGKHTYTEVCTTIESAINMHKNKANCAKAVKKWRSDLEYIGNYVRDNPNLRD